jgi:uncharacterized protein (TIGR02145 family)
MSNLFTRLCVASVFCCALSLVAQEADTASIPFIVNVNATVKADKDGNTVMINVTANEAGTLKIPLGSATSVRHRTQNARNNAPVITNDQRGRISLILTDQNYQTAEISLYSVNGKRVLRSMATASQTSKNISRPNLVAGVYLLTVKGVNGQSFTNRLTHRGGSLNVNVAFGGDSFSSPASPVALSKYAVANAPGNWEITVSAPEYVDSSYILNVVKDMNEVQNITLRAADSDECSSGDHFNSSITYGCFTDERDSTKYRTVTIGTQTWMAENLNFAGDEETEVGACYKNSPDSCARYGRLYDWSTVMGFEPSCNSARCSDQVQSPHRGICPVGWHVPSNDEWQDLVKYVDPNTVNSSNWAGRRLRSVSYWVASTSTNIHGFSALPGGHGNSNGFYNAGYYGEWWSATEYDVDNAWGRSIGNSSDNMSRNWTSKALRYSLRCVEN